MKSGYLDGGLAQHLDHLGALGVGAVRQVLAEQSVQQTVIEDALGDDGLDRLVHVLEEGVALGRMLLQRLVQRRDALVFEHLELGPVKLLRQQRPLRRVRPIVVRSLHHFGRNLERDGKWKNSFT